MLLLFKKKLISFLRMISDSQKNWTESTKKQFPHTSCPHTCITFSSTDNPHHHGPFVTINESTFKLYFPSKLMMYIRICSWWCVIFILPIVFPFPECHIVGIMLYRYVWDYTCFVRDCLQKWPFCIPTRNKRSFCYSTSLFGVVSVLDFGHCDRCIALALKQHT